MADLLAALRNAGINSTNYAKQSTKIAIRESGVCQYQGKEIYVAITSLAPKEVKSYLTALGGINLGYMLIKQNWLFNVDDADLTQELSKRLGMEIL
jgi:hypothetical protein